MCLTAFARLRWRLLFSRAQSLVRGSNHALVQMFYAQRRMPQQPSAGKKGVRGKETGRRNARVSFPRQSVVSVEEVAFFFLYSTFLFFHERKRKWTVPGL